MSVFDFPRIHFKGTIKLNPGTANNDDYAPAAAMPASWGAFAGQPFGLVDSKLVQARTFGMSDAAFMEWVQQPQTLDSTSKPGTTTEIMPAEWNYYGDMRSDVQAAVVGVQTAPGNTFTSADPNVALTSLLGGKVAFDGGITDVNPEGSPPATQFFINTLTVSDGQTDLVKGRPTKGACQWLNFYRNVNLTGDSAAGAYVHSVLHAGPETTIDLPGFDAPHVKGLVLRYYVFHIVDRIKDHQALKKLYAEKGTNPAVLEVAGTIAPLLDTDEIITGPVGRLMVQFNANIWPPPGSTNNATKDDGTNGPVSLAPAVLRQTGTIVSADFIASFPDYFQKSAAGSINPKFDFGPVRLVVTGGGATAGVGEVPYADTQAGDARGWVFDFDLEGNTAAQKALQDSNATFSLIHPTYGAVLDESKYYIVSNQQAIYGEQCGPGDSFRNQGTLEPVTLSVYSRGKLLSKEECPPMTIWQYASTPLEAPGDAVAVNSNFRPGDRFVVDTAQPGNFLFTFTINDADNQVPGGYPPKNYLTYQDPPWITNAPSISLRILPNEDYSRYYVDPSADEPVGNDALTWDLVYRNSLQVYYLLFPAMNKHIQLNSEPAVRHWARQILERTELNIWMSTGYMPPTRDMSESRRNLLRAWCRKALKETEG